MMGCSSGFTGSVLPIFILFTVFCISNATICTSSNSKGNWLNLLEEKKCPELFGDQDETFCCDKDGSIYCCEFDEFVRSQSIEYIIPVIVGVLVSILAGCFICCLCCPCCMLYKRRHRGTVYGRVQQPAGAVVNIPYPVQNMPPAGAPQPTAMPVQQPMTMPMPQSMAMPMQQPMTMPMPQPGCAAPYPPYPSGDFAGQAQMPPPPYSAAVTKEGYATQAPFNPTYYNH